MKIREAKREDIKHIANLNVQLFEYHLQFDARAHYYELRPNSEKTAIKHLDDMLTSEDSTIFVAEERGTIVGYIAGEIVERLPVFEVDKRGDIWEGFVLEEFRGRGIGRQLTERMLRWFKEGGIGYAQLSVDSRNELGYNIWGSLGFETFQFKMIRRIQPTSMGAQDTSPDCSPEKLKQICDKAN